MGFVTRDTGLGLTLVENRGSEAELSRALKRIDDRLVLQRHPGNVEGGWVYKVLKIVSEDQPAVRITTWADEYGRPLPLSSGLLDRVQKLMVGARNQGVSTDDHNRQLADQRDKDRLSALEQVSGEHRAKVERGQVTVGFGSGTSRRYYQRNHRPPSGAAA